MISMKTEMIEMNKYIVIKTTFVDGELNTENKIFTDKTEAYQYANDVIDEMCKPFEIANESLIEEVQDRYHVIYNDKHTFVASVRIINKEYGKYAYIVREVETHNCNVIESECRVFKSRGSAEKCFNALIKEIEEYSRFYDNGVLRDNCHVSVTADNYLIQESESYDNSIEITITEYELED